MMFYHTPLQFKITTIAGLLMNSMLLFIYFVYDLAKDSFLSVKFLKNDIKFCDLLTLFNA